MQDLLKNIQIKVNDKTFVKNPQSSSIGQSIVNTSIKLIHIMGLEAFTFKKLATELGTTESTVYRYFENKHKLLIYLISWYWGWLEYEIVLNSINIADPLERLRKTIDTICNPLKNGIEHDHIKLRPLREIVIEESPKAFFTKDVDSENQNGLFANYKRINDRLIGIIKEVNPSYKFAVTLSSIIIDSSNQQRFCSLHFPSLTDFKENESSLGTFLSDMVLKTINNK
jgi:AcrR family transcriptional regulator